VKLFAKGKGEAAPAHGPSFSPIDRTNLLGLLDQVVNGGQSGVLELHEPRGNWVYAFQAGALTHASGGRVRGARQAFDLLWEFQAGEFMFRPGVDPSLPGNLYIDKNRLLDLLRRSQAVLQGPSAPYIPPDQMRPIAPVPRPYSPPSPAQMPPAWQPGMQQGQVPGWPPVQPQAPGWPPAYPPQMAPPAQPYPAAPPQAPYPAAPMPGGQPLPPQAYPPVRGNVRPPAAPAPQAPSYPGYAPQAPMSPPAQSMPPQMPSQAPYATPPQPMPQAMPGQPMPPQAPAFASQPPMPPAAPARPAPSFSVPPMPIPKKAQQVPTYQPPAAAPMPPAPEPAKAAPPKDDLAALRASLVAQAPVVKPAPAANWGVRTAGGTVTPPPAAVDPKAKGKGKAKGQKKGDSKLMAAIKLQLIKFLLWACERRYSPDDHWTLKDAFEVSTMELRDQFFGAFSQTLASTKRSKPADDDMDDMAAGRMRGRARRH
jgi:hypothetical protein